MCTVQRARETIDDRKDRKDEDDWFGTAVPKEVCLLHASLLRYEVKKRRKATTPAAWKRRSRAQENNLAPIEPRCVSKALKAMRDGENNL